MKYSVYEQACLDTDRYSKYQALGKFCLKFVKDFITPNNKIGKPVFLSRSAVTPVLTDKMAEHVWENRRSMLSTTNISQSSANKS